MELVSTELTPAEIAIIFSKGAVAVKPTPHSSLQYSMTKADYSSMLPKMWLRTEAINLVCTALLEGLLEDWPQSKDFVRYLDVYVTTMLMGCDEECILLSLEGLGLFSPATAYWLIPVNTENKSGSHWLFLLFQNGLHAQTVSPVSRIVVFDSTSCDLSTAHTLAAKFKQMARLFHKVDMIIQVHAAGSIPKQSNSHDCGVYAIGYCEHTLKQIGDHLASERTERPRFGEFGPDCAYLLGNSELTRTKYRRMVEQILRDPALRTG